eukprot:4571428-Pleurochrysis_carterae.AAC.2
MSFSATSAVDDNARLPTAVFFGSTFDRHLGQSLCQCLPPQWRHRPNWADHSRSKVLHGASGAFRVAVVSFVRLVFSLVNGSFGTRLGDESPSARARFKGALLFACLQFSEHVANGRDCGGEASSGVQHRYLDVKQGSSEFTDTAYDM